MTWPIFLVAFRRGVVMRMCLAFVTALVLFGSSMSLSAGQKQTPPYRVGPLLKFDLSEEAGMGFKVQPCGAYFAYGLPTSTSESGILAFFVTKKDKSVNIFAGPPEAFQLRTVSDVMVPVLWNVPEEERSSDRILEILVSPQEKLTSPCLSRLREVGDRPAD